MEAHPTERSKIEATFTGGISAMDLLRSRGLVRRILLLSAVLGVLILSEGSKPPRETRPAPRPARPLAAAKKVPAPPVPPRREREFFNFEGRKSGLSFAKDEAHVYLFDLEPDDFVDIEVDQQGVDVAAKIFPPGAEVELIEVDRLNDKNGPENIPLLADHGSGRYKVELDGQGGIYQIRVLPKHKATSLDCQNAAGAAAYFRGKGLKREGKPREAEQELRQALASWKTSGYLAGQADANRHLGGVFGGRGANREAVPFLKKAADLYHELGNSQQELVVLQDLGRAHKALGNNDQALACFKQALALASSLQSPKAEADILDERGGLYSEAGEFTKALKDLEQALATRRAADPDDLPHTLNVLGRSYYLQNELDRALELHREALALVRDRRDDDGYAVGETLVHLGDVYRKQGDFRKATGHYLQALSRFQDRYPREEAIALNNLALTYLDAGNYHDALSAFQHCQRVFEALSDNESVAGVWANMGWVLTSTQRYAEAFDAYERALVTSHGKKRLFLEVASYYGLARIELRRGNLVRAPGYIEKSIAAMESIRTKAANADLRSSFLAGKQEIYDLLVEIRMGQHRREPTKGYDLKALEGSEKARSRRLVEDLEGRVMVPSVSVQYIQSQVLGAEATVLLEYFLGEQRSYLWVVTSSSFTSYEIPASRAQIEKLAQEVHNLLEVSHKVEKRRMAIRKSLKLSRLLFGQVASRLEGKKLLIVAPPELQYVAFGALPEDLRESVQRDDAWPRAWILDHEITVEPSATVLGTLRRLNEGQEPPSGLIAILADPVYSLDDGRMGSKRARDQRSHFPRLTFSPKEVKAIERALAEAGLGSAKRLVAKDFDANRQRVLSGDLKGFQYLHFSAHGELDDRNADRSAIVLSLVDREGKRIDGYLHAGEIAKLDLPADLVVLSACRTGLGRKIRGEGLVGLTQAFFTAGASRVIVSLWDVGDQATADLMRRFYRGLLQKHLSPAAALREAQVSMWREPRWNAPSYWGGFVLQGEWK
jgi:CHAT domain-containing protein/Tfp pilus assembly protein PilF